MPSGVEIALARELRLHQDAGAGAVGELRGVAGGDVLARLLQMQPLGEDGLERREAGERRVGADALVVLQRDRLVGDGAGRLVDDLHHARQGRDLGVEPAGGHARGGARLRLRADTRPGARARSCSARRRFRRSRASTYRCRRDARRATGPSARVAVHLVVLDQRNRFEPAADGDAHAVVDDLLGGDGDRHQARGALPVDRHAGDAGRKPGAQERLAGDVAALRALLQRRAHHHVVDLAALDRGALQRARRSHGRPASGPGCR